MFLLQKRKKYNEDNEFKFYCIKNNKGFMFLIKEG